MSGDHAPETLRRYGEAQARLEHAGGYGWRDHATSVLRGLGFADADLDRGLETFSGGELTRASLARALSGSPDLLLLDRPTNHLDMESMEWLEQELSTIDAATSSSSRTTAGSSSRSARPCSSSRTAARPTSRASGTSGAGEGGAARDAGEVRRAPGGGHRAPRALRRPLPLRTKSRQAQAKLKQIAWIEAERVEAPKTGRRRSASSSGPARSGRMVVEAEGFDLAAG